MWIPKNIVDRVDEVALIYYVDKTTTALWNRNRLQGELRLLTGWGWAMKSGGRRRQGFKTKTVAYRDAYYALIQRREAPSVSSRGKHLRLVKAA
jgi:hypothetical protein